MNNAEKVLKDIFGYQTFRPLQSEIITSVISKKDSLVVMPTGGGKSICYQVPAIIFEGLTIVISPLISLMKDQVAQLKLLGVPTALLNSSLTKKEYADNYELVKCKKAKLLYLAPESLAKADINSLFTVNKIECIAVDEAHCISEWGHDFRKEYRQLGSFRKRFPEAVCLGLTATATPRVQDDIVKSLNLDSGNKYIASFNRENLFLEVIPKSDPFGQTLDFLNVHKKQPGIIYCFSRKQVDELHEDLTDAGFSTRPYHAGLSDEERHKNQDLFINDKVDIIIATIAFGMGINKSNVRFVVHYDLPKNIESYYQEIGRSGRDGLKADCLLLFGYGDTAKINYFIDQKENEQERRIAKIHLDAMVRYAEAAACRRIKLITYFGESYNAGSCGMCDNCVGSDKEITDITIPAQKFLSAVKRTGEIFGANYIIDVLAGSENDKIFSNQHQKLTVFGIGREFTKKQWLIIARQLVTKDYLSREPEFGSLKVTESGYNILKNLTRVFGEIKEQKPRVHIKNVYDEELFELLREERRDAADEDGVAPYMVFSDKTLSEMAMSYPETKSDMLLITGVGFRKFEIYGKRFIEVIKKYRRERGVIKQRHNPALPVISGKRVNKKYAEDFNKGRSIESLCKQHAVKPDTVLKHLFTFVESGGRVRIEGLTEMVALSEEQKTAVYKDFEEYGTDTLKPIFEKYNGRISYFELRILKLLYILSSPLKQR